MDALLAINPVAPLPQRISSLGQRLTDVVITYLKSKAEAELAFRFKQPTALGKLIAVLLMGVYGLQSINSQQPVLGLLLPVGVLLLLFEIGLKWNLKSLLKIDPQAPTRGLVGMAMPFALGYSRMKGMGSTDLVSIFVGASITAASIGVIAKVLSELGYLKRVEGKIVLGAVVLHDILGVFILSTVSGLTSSTSLNALDKWKKMLASKH